MSKDWIVYVNYIARAWIEVSKKCQNDIPDHMINSDLLYIHYILIPYLEKLLKRMRHSKKKKKKANHHG